MSDQRSQAESFARAIEDQTGERLDFSLGSFAVLDAVFTEWRSLAGAYGDDAPWSFVPMVESAACYVSEVLRRAGLGDWLAQTHDAAVARSSARDGSLVNPHSAVVASLEGRAPLSELLRRIVAHGELIDVFRRLE